MKNKMKRMALAVIVLLNIPTLAVAQDKPEASLQIDLMSSYLWRGTEKGGICLQPIGNVSWKGASLQVLGSTGLRSDDVKEIDVNLGYKWKEFNVGLTDYWQTGLDYDGNNLYFFYDAHRSGHRLEVNFGYTHRYFSVQAYTMIYGNDFKRATLAEQNALAGKRAFSTYIEVSAPFSWAGIDWDGRLGITPFAGANNIEQVGELNGNALLKRNYFYADGIACIRASLRLTKSLAFSGLKVPIFAELHANPYMKTANFMVGLSVIPFQSAKK